MFVQKTSSLKNHLRYANDKQNEKNRIVSKWTNICQFSSSFCLKDVEETMENHQTLKCNKTESPRLTYEKFRKRGNPHVKINALLYLDIFDQTGKENF